MDFLQRYLKDLVKACTLSNIFNISLLDIINLHSNFLSLCSLYLTLFLLYKLELNHVIITLNQIWFVFCWSGPSLRTNLNCRGNSTIQITFASTNKSCQAKELWVEPYGFDKTWWLEIYFHFEKPKWMSKYCMWKIQHQEKCPVYVHLSHFLGTAFLQLKMILCSVSSEKRETCRVRVLNEKCSDGTRECR